MANTHGTIHEDARRTTSAREGEEEGDDVPVGIPLQSGPLITSVQSDEGSLSSDDLVDTQLVNDQEQGLCVCI